jgi:DNA-binding beta-propeller fold protein YncE
MADTNNNRIARITASTTLMQQGFIGSTGSGYVDAIGVSALFASPTSVHFHNASQYLYITDSVNHRIRRLAPSRYTTEAVSTVAGNGIAALVNGAALSASFFSPGAVIVSVAGIVYVADTSNQAIRMMSLSVGVVSTLAGSGVGGFANGVGTSSQFTFPRGLALSRDESTLYVSDSGNHRIRMISLSGGVVSSLAGSGSASFADGVGPLASFF